jgi:hypothetical protein
VPRGRAARLGVAFLVIALAGGVGYLVGVRPLAIEGDWAVVGTEIDVDEIGGRPDYEVGFTPDVVGVRFALMLRNGGPLPMTVRLPAADEQAAADLDRIVGLRVVKVGQAEGSISEEATVAVEDVEIPAFGERRVAFEGRSAGCEVARRWNAEARQSRGAIALEATILGIGHEISLVLPFGQVIGPPPPGVCP